MAVARPFRGLRPGKEYAAKVAAPPYDVLDSDEAREMAKGNPWSILHVTKPEIDLDPSIDPYDDRVYARGARNLRTLMEEGILRQDPEPLFYFYRQVMGAHSQTGLIACASIEDYEKDIIRKHEFTRKDKEQDRIRHIETDNAQVGPVFLTYPDIPGVTAIAERVCSGVPEFDFVAPDGVRHTVWLVPDPADMASISKLFEEIPCLYVADGHHRSAAATIVGQKRRAANPFHTGLEEYNFFLAVIFPKSHMRIMPYNRVVADLHGLSQEQFLTRLGEKFRIETCETEKPAQIRQFSMYMDGRWYLLHALPGSFPEGDPVGSLDVSILQDNLLGPILGIDDPRTSKRINFIGGIRGAAELVRLVDSGRYAVAFSLHATTMDQLLSVASSGNVMPPKSTWFEPKLRSGLVIHVL
jgi:uncharacterized protein (DUF1015 family)